MNEQEEYYKLMKEAGIDIEKDSWEEMIDKIKKSNTPYEELKETKD